MQRSHAFGRCERDASRANRIDRRRRRFFFAAIVALLPGILRDEVVTSIVGVAVAGIIAASLAIDCGRRFRGRRAFVGIAVHPREIGNDGSVTLSVEIPPRLRNGVVHVELAFGDRTVAVGPQRIADSTLRIDGVRRGVYVVRSCEIRRFDPFSIGYVAFRGGSDETVLRVLPGRTPVEAISPIDGTSFPSLTEEISVQRNDELIEARPYHPGDDPRRIHWGMYAHTTELFLRIGEESPPPKQTWSVVLDIEGATRAEEIDRLTAVAIGVAESIRSEGRTVAIGLLDRGIRWYPSVDIAAWAWAALEPFPTGRHEEIIEAVDLVVASAASPRAPTTVGRGWVGAVFLGREGTNDAYRLADST